MTTATKHTPGPWVAERNHDGDLIVSRLGDDGQEIVVMRGADGPESEANAALVAAAPDLLASCEGLIPNIDELGRLARAIDLGCHPDARNLVSALVAVIRMAEAQAEYARSAIAAAKGQ